jgi:hypothetical protein
MTKEEVVNLMLESMEQDNREMCERSGMPKEEAEKFMEQSRPSIVYMLDNIYGKLSEKGIIVEA